MESLKKRLNINIIAIYSISLITSLPGLAIAPILGELESIFKDTSAFELQLLETLPSIVIIPFMFLSGHLSVSIRKHLILIIGLSLFVISSFAYLFTKSLWAIQINGILLGVGAGLVIPLSTGYIADYFQGENRVRELGIVSGISNIVLVLATLLAGWLAKISWQYAFLVYFISIIPLILSKKVIDKSNSGIGSSSMAKFSLKQIVKNVPLDVLWIYFTATIVALTVPMNLSILLQDRSVGAGVSGTLISVFFLAIMTPGFILPTVIRIFRKQTQRVSYIFMLIGNLLFLLSGSYFAIILAVILIGLGYGTIQPLIYDETAKKTAPNYATFALSVVMSMNYFAILFYPLIMSLLSYIDNAKRLEIPFMVCAILSVLLIVMGNRFTNIMDNSEKRS